jgi:hypothetical protein
MDTFISPNYTQDKLDNPTMEDLIDVLKDRVINWLFEPAKKLLTEKENWFGGLCLLLTYFEGMWSYVIGVDSKGNSKRYFKDAFLDVFAQSGPPPDLLSRVAEVLYEDGRCGFFHDGMLRTRIFMVELRKDDILITLPRKKDGSIDVDGQIQSILIDPRRFMAAIERHFIDYLLCLRNPQQTLKRENFLKVAKDKWDYEGPGTVIGLNPDGTM